MINPFTDDKNREIDDQELISHAVAGDKAALEALVKRHQDWFYNIALRMVWDPQDARDVTQKVLIKIITRLHSFKGNSSFRTCAYRIVANHVLNMKQRGLENPVSPFKNMANPLMKPRILICRSGILSRSRFTT